MAVLHNFVWHQHWTWRDRPSASAPTVAVRLVRFHLLNGTVSLVGNLAVMAVLCGALGMDPVAANVVAIAAVLDAELRGERGAGVQDNDA